MRVSGVKIAGPFKRFGSLGISSIGSEVDLVVMLGPNGSGKSSVFDAFLEWARHRGRPAQRQIPGVYFDSETGTPSERIRPKILASRVATLFLVRAA